MNAPRPPPWSTLAACSGQPLGLFFPSVGDHISVRKARRICACCPVRVACLEDALATGDRWGMRGGLSPRQRRQIEERAEAS